jgi:hypothetical protein
MENILGIIMLSEKEKKNTTPIQTNNQNPKRIQTISLQQIPPFAFDFLVFARARFWHAVVLRPVFVLCSIPGSYAASGLWPRLQDPQFGACGERRVVSSVRGL